VRFRIVGVRCGCSTTTCAAPSVLFRPARLTIPHLTNGAILPRSSQRSLPLLSIISPPASVTVMAGRRGTAPFSAPSADERAHKDSLRALSYNGARTADVMPSLSATPSAAPTDSFGAGTGLQRGVHGAHVASPTPNPVFYDTQVGDAPAVMASVAGDKDLAGNGVAGVALSAASTTLHALLPRLVELDEAEVAFTPVNSTPPAERPVVKLAAATKPKRPATTARSIRPAPTRRSSLPAAPSLASSLRLDAAAGSSKEPINGYAGSPSGGASSRAARTSPAGHVTASNAVPAKVVASQVADFKNVVTHAAGSEKPFAEALAGLLRLSGQSAVLDNNAKSTHGASLNTLAKAMDSLEVSAIAKRPAVAHPPAITVDNELDEDTGCEAAPEAKRSKISSFVQPPDSDGSGAASCRSDEKPRTVAKPPLRVPPLTAAQQLVFATAAERTRKRAEGLTVMIGARRLLKMRIKLLTGTAKESADSFLSPRRRTEEMVRAVRDHAKCTDSKATEFLLEKILKPTRVEEKRRKHGGGDEMEDDGKPCSERTTGVNHKLKEGVSHVYGALKRNVVWGWFYDATNNPKSSMRPGRATKWLERDAFYKQPGGRRAILAAATKGYKYLGALNRVHMAVSEGSDAVVELTRGFFVLCVKFIREELVSVQDQAPVKQGPDLNRYKDYVAEFLRLDGWLPRHGRAENGMRLCDGADANRAVFDPEYLPAANVTVESGTAAVTTGGQPCGTGLAASQRGHRAVPWPVEQAVRGPEGRVVRWAIGQAAAAGGRGEDQSFDAMETGRAARCGRVEGNSSATVMPAPALVAPAAATRETATLMNRAPTMAAPEAEAPGGVPVLSRRARAAAIMAKAQAEAAALLELEDGDELL